MLTAPTTEKLKAWGLDAMASAWTEQKKDAGRTKLACEGRLGWPGDQESLFRETRRRGRLLKEAKLKLGQACVEDIDYPPKRELDKAVIRQLATCRWVQEHQNVIVTGMTGVGKTYIACAMAQHACRRGFSAIYRRASRLFDELTLARADGTFARLLSKFARTDVLVIDDWGLTAAREQERQDLLEILEDRYATRSTIMTSQIPANDWHTYLAAATLADAILDRVLHNAHTVLIKCP